MAVTFFNSVQGTAEQAKFSKRLIQSFKCFVNSKPTSTAIQSEMESICMQFHFLRTNEAFHTAWSDFLQKIGVEVRPSFYQHVSQNVIEFLTRQLLTTPQNNPTALTQNTGLNNIEQNALRYVGGYICRKVTKQLQMSKHPKKEQLLLFMLDITGFESDEDTSEEWTKQIDRGGLCYINTSTFEFFLEVELHLRKFFNFKAAVSGAHQSKVTIIEHIQACKEVLYSWHILTENDGYDLLVTDELYSQLISEFVTVRGFYFASSIVESYKKISKKGLQKSKGLRKQI